MIPPTFGLSQSPRITVAMCARNEAPFIRDAIYSILNQTESDWELIVIDDSSEDATPAILQEMVDPRVRSIRNPSPMGIPASRNIATAAARAPIIAVMDADDVAAPERLREQLSFLERNPWVGAVGTYVEVVDGQGTSIGILKTPIDGAEARRRRFEAVPLIHPSLAIRKDVLEALGGYRERFRIASDFDLLCRLCEYCEVATIPTNLCRYRLSPKSVSVRNRRQQAFFCKLAKRFAVERERSGHDAYETADMRPPGVCSEEPSEAAYHLFLGKLAMTLGNPESAESHLRRAALLAPWALEPRGLAVLLRLGVRPYGLLRRLFGSA